MEAIFLFSQNRAKSKLLVSTLVCINMLYLSLLIAHHKFCKSFYMKLDESIEPYINIFRMMMMVVDGWIGWLDS